MKYILCILISFSGFIFSKEIGLKCKEIEWKSRGFSLNSNNQRKYRDWKNWEVKSPRVHGLILDKSLNKVDSSFMGWKIKKRFTEESQFYSWGLYWKSGNEISREEFLNFDYIGSSQNNYSLNRETLILEDFHTYIDINKQFGIIGGIEQIKNYQCEISQVEKIKESKKENLEKGLERKKKQEEKYKI